MARVGLDIDGVLYPFEVELHKYAFGTDEFCESCFPIETWDFFEEWGKTREWFTRTCNQGVNNGELFWKGEPYEGAIEQVRRLYDAGHTIVFITSRNYGDEGASEAATKCWLDRYFSTYQLHLAQDKTTVQVDYFIDDNVEHFESMYRARVKAFLCDRPWNQDCDTPHRGTLEEFVDKVLDREGAPIKTVTIPVIQQHDKPLAWRGGQECWTCERNDVLDRFAEELEKVTGDGSRKRQAGEKPPWYRDSSHEGAIFSHLTKWKRGEQVDPDSGAHPLVHLAWRALAIACSENGNNPDGQRPPEQ